MAYTPTTVIGARLAEKLAAWADEEGDLNREMDAIGTMAEPLALVIEDQGFDGQPGFVPSYGRVMNPDECPADFLPWLGMFVGVPIPEGMPEAEARELIKLELGIHRGTQASIEQAITRTLGPVPFLLLSRTDESGSANPYWFIIVLPKGHGEPGPVETAIRATKPAGLRFAVIEREGTWFSATLKWEEIKAGTKWSGLTEAELT
jgi:hypothetical protein